MEITNEKLFSEMQKLNEKQAKINISQARGEEKLVNIESQMKRINGNVHSHCGSIKELKTDQTVIKTEIEPIKKLYGKLTDFSIGIIIAIGSVAVGIIYFIKQHI